MRGRLLPETSAAITFIVEQMMDSNVDPTELDTANKEDALWVAVLQGSAQKDAVPTSTPAPAILPEHDVVADAADSLNGAVPTEPAAEVFVQDDSTHQVADSTEPATGAPFLVAQSLSLKSPVFRAYENVSLSVMRGQVCAVAGENGSGKKELLLTLAGRMRPTSGKLVVGGHASPGHRGRIRKIAGMGFISRVNDVQPALSVRAVVAGELNLYSRRSGRKATAAFLAEWGLEDLAKEKVNSLRQMEYDRLGIALGMAGSPELLVVDDIEGDLTRAQSEQLMALLKDIARTHATTVVVSVVDPGLAQLADVVVPINGAAAPKEEEDA